MSKLLLILALLLPSFASADTYSWAVKRDTPVSYWRLGELSGTTATDLGSAASNGTYAPSTSGSWTGGTQGVTSPLVGDSNKAVTFNGSSGRVSAPLNLSGTNVVSVEFWLLINTYTNDDRIAAELTTNFNSSTGGFLIDPNSSSPADVFSIAHRATNYSVAVYPRPSAGAWHHYVAVFDRSLSTNECSLYVDGVLQTPSSRPTNTNTTGNFANSTIYLGSRAGTSLFLDGSMDEVAVYSYAISATQAKWHYIVGKIMFGLTGNF